MSVVYTIPLSTLPANIVGGSVSSISSLSTASASTGSVSLDVSGGSGPLTLKGGTAGVIVDVSSTLTTSSEGISIGTSAVAPTKTGPVIVSSPALSSSVFSNNYTLATGFTVGVGPQSSIQLTSSVNLVLAVGTAITLISGSNTQIVTIQTPNVGPTSTLFVNNFTPNYSYPSLTTIVNIATLTVNGPFESGPASIVGPLLVTGSVVTSTSVIGGVEQCNDLSTPYTTDGSGTAFVNTTFLLSTTSTPAYNTIVTLSSPTSSMNGFRKRIILAQWLLVAGSYTVTIVPDVGTTHFYPPGSSGSSHLIFDTQGQAADLTWNQTMRGWYVSNAGGTFA